MQRDSKSKPIVLTTCINLIYKETSLIWFVIATWSIMPINTLQTCIPRIAKIKKKLNKLASFLRNRGTLGIWRINNNRKCVGFQWCMMSSTTRWSHSQKICLNELLITNKTTPSCFKKLWKLSGNHKIFKLRFSSKVINLACYFHLKLL